eukprot:734527_1
MLNTAITSTTMQSTSLSSSSSSSLPMKRNSIDEDTICLGFVGDIMLGRGIDAILPHHVDGTLHESYMKHAKGYVNLAIRENGPLDQNELNNSGFNYIWGNDLIEIFSSIP